MGIVSDSAIVDVLVGVLSLLILSYFYLTSTYNYWQDRGVPFIKPIILFGNIKDVLLGRKSIIEVHTSLYKQFEGERFGGYFVLKRPVLMVRDPELIERILVKDFAHFHDRGMTTDPDHEPLTLNLFNAKGQQWRNLRYKLTPTFTSGKLKGMFEQIYNCGEDLLKELQKYAKSGEDVEAKNLFSMFTTDVIASCAFGLQLRGGSSEAETFKTMTDKIFLPSRMQTLQFNLRSLYPRLTRWLGITTFGKDVNEYFLNITKATIQLRESKGTKRNDFVQLLMNLKDQELMGRTSSVPSSEISEEDKVINQAEYTPPDTGSHQNNEKLFTDECIAAQTFVFLIAGSESSSGALSFILYCLAKNLEVQMKAQAEIDQVLAKYGSWTYQTLKDMIYLDQIIQESMRMFPIATFLSRDCTVPYQLPGTDLVLEEGQRVIIPVPALQNDPRNYPQPHIFDPDRFRDNNHKPSPTYLPFGDGPRICIAMRFAVLEMKVCLARVLSQYSVCLSDKTQEPITYLPGSFFPQAVGGIWITVQKRLSKAG